ncbi:hypothetical protein TRIUR3_29143 [Triticum urartu]|uniref:E3 ubiquitin-protein ligase TRIP12-like TPR repeats domain-containing protein n=1 Tax=Triticum urartu TaxID=4572 RepID=M7ZZA6_TRIUA|nr:hypothetical protein TRIUR3_29143 [Triticum urartu]
MTINKAFLVDYCVPFFKLNDLKIAHHACRLLCEKDRRRKLPSQPLLRPPPRPLLRRRHPTPSIQRCRLSFPHRVYPRRRRIAWTEETPCRHAPFCRDGDGDGKGRPKGGKFRRMVAAVASEGAGGGALLASLTEPCEALSFYTEDAGGYFPVESAARALVRLADTEVASPDEMLLAVRSITCRWHFFSLFCRIELFTVVPGFLLYRGLHELGQYAFLEILWEPAIKKEFLLYPVAFLVRY